MRAAQEAQLAEAKARQAELDEQVAARKRARQGRNRGRDLLQFAEGPSTSLPDTLG